MERMPVTSTTLTSIGYDDASATLEVEFASGVLYQYFDVPRPVFDDLLSGGGSVGAYFNQHVKGVYRYARL
jgi:hypothetical protein